MFSAVDIYSDSTIVNYIGNSTVIITSQYSIPIGSYILLQYASAINSNNVPQTELNYVALNGIKILGGMYEV
jgi:hypothetical protein